MEEAGGHPTPTQASLGPRMLEQQAGSGRGPELGRAALGTGCAEGQLPLGSGEGPGAWALGSRTRMRKAMGASLSAGCPGQRHRTSPLACLGVGKHRALTQEADSRGRVGTASSTAPVDLQRGHLSGHPAKL